MVCKKCAKIVCMQAFCSSRCKICNTTVNTGHIPGYKVCESCAKKANLCPQCGESSMKTCVVCKDNLTDHKDGICEICKHKADKYGYYDDLS